MRPKSRDIRLEALYRDAGPGALRLAYLLTGDSEESQDLVQDAFVKLTSRWSLIRDPNAADRYLQRTVANLAKNHFRKKKLRSHLPVRPNVDSTDDASAATEERDQLRELLGDLTYRQRAALVFRFYCDLSEADTAEILGCSVPAVKALTVRGLAHLRKITEEEVRP